VLSTLEKGPYIPQNRIYPHCCVDEPVTFVPDVRLRLEKLAQVRILVRIRVERRALPSWRPLYLFEIRHYDSLFLYQYPLQQVAERIDEVYTYLRVEVGQDILHVYRRVCNADNSVPLVRGPLVRGADGANKHLRVVC